MTGFPPVGPASAYPILSRPASICLSEENEVVLGLAVTSTAGEFAPASPKSGCCANSAVPTETPAMARRRRRETPFGSVCCIIRVSSCGTLEARDPPSKPNLGSLGRDNRHYYERCRRSIEVGTKLLSL